MLLYLISKCQYLHKYKWTECSEKRERLSDLKKQSTNIWSLSRDTFKHKNTERLKEKKIYHANTSQNKDGIAKLVSEKTDIKEKVSLQLKESLQR